LQIVRDCESNTPRNDAHRGVDMTTYLETGLYRRLAEALCGAAPCAVTGLIADDQIKIILGEIGNIWPDCIRDCCEVDKMAIYLQTDLYRGLAKALCRASPCAVTGRVAVDQIKIVLGELGDVWPSWVFDDYKKSLH
jgi:hypothetical protein